MLYHMPMQLGAETVCGHSGLLVLEGELPEPWRFKHLLRGGQGLEGASQRAQEFW